MRLASRRRFLGQLGAASAVTLLATRLRAQAGAVRASIPDDILYTSAKRLAAMVQAKQISSLELTQAYLARIEAVNPTLNAVVLLTAERALAEAAEADAMLAKGTVLGPLHGVPFTVKDSLATAGIVSTGGTLGRKNHIPGKDATAIARLRQAGAILMGKTNTPELTMSFKTTNLLFGATHNPYRHGHQPGGSSGGAAAIIAAGGSPFDIGTDFGGSVRHPAHCCGIAGLKPSTGRVPRTGHIVGYGGYFDPMQTVGPLARWVEDLELLGDLIRGPDYLDAAIVPAPWLPPAEVDLKQLKVAYYTDNGSKDPVTPETAAAVRKAVAILEAAGVTCIEDCPTELHRESQELRGELSSADGRAWVRRLLEGYGTKQVSPVVGLSEEGQCDVERFTELAELMDVNRSKLLQWLQSYDLVLAPVLPTPAEPWPDDLDASFGATGNINYTATYNNTGWPGTVVRVGTSPEGLPIGVQLLAPPFREDLALAAAYVVEAGSGGYQRPPI